MVSIEDRQTISLCKSKIFYVLWEWESWTVIAKNPPYVILSHVQFDQEYLCSGKFQQQIKIYNMMFSFTSLGKKLDNQFNNGGGPLTVRIQG